MTEPLHRIVGPFRGEPPGTIGVVGAGTMGRGIAEVLIRHGYTTFLYDTSTAALRVGMESIARAIDRGVEKGRLTSEERETALARLQPTSELAALIGADLVIEAVTEQFDIKTAVFREIERHCRPGVVLATNTSAISITRLAAVTRRPELVVGIHFFNPVPIMKLVEIVPGLQTDPEVVEAARRFVVSLGKTPVRVSDHPGFVSNRLLMPMINEAVYCLMEGVADAQAVDTVMKLGMNHPMGPLELADLIGLDVCLDIMRALFDGFKDSKYRPCPLLERMVSAGWLGRKTGRGFYEYPAASQNDKS
jgi:3-hydroxybutyryl-CoA dehydrogenase